MHPPWQRFFRICSFGIAAILAVPPVSFAQAGTADVDDSFGPWSVSDRCPVINRQDPSVPEESLGQDYCYMLLHFYQKDMSVVVASHCPMVPSCSNYSIAAIRKDGPWMGMLLTVDRLIHEGDERHYVREIWQDGKLKYWDPVENNDFWWHKK